jgi:hypothetical protein
MNSMNANYYNPQPNAQFQVQQQFQMQQQQWAMQNGMLANQMQANQQSNQQQFYATNGGGTPQATTPTG